MPQYCTTSGYYQRYRVRGVFKRGFRGAKYFNSVRFTSNGLFAASTRLVYHMACRSRRRRGRRNCDYRRYNVTGRTWYIVVLYRALLRAARASYFVKRDFEKFLVRLAWVLNGEFFRAGISAVTGIFMAVSGRQFLFIVGAVNAGIFRCSRGFMDATFDVGSAACCLVSPARPFYGILVRRRFVLFTNRASLFRLRSRRDKVIFFFLAGAKERGYLSALVLCRRATGAGTQEM